MGRGKVLESRCEHVGGVHPKLCWDIIKCKVDQGDKLCYECDRSFPDSDTWLCLHCLKTFCSTESETDEDNDHSLNHSKSDKHHLALCLNDNKVWCYFCSCEVYFKKEKRFNTPPFVIPQCLNIEKLISPISLQTFNYMESTTGHQLGLAGLRNLGNTCYMNSALQALSSCKMLTSYFLHHSAHLDLSVTKLVSDDYSKFIKEKWSPARPSVVSPNYLIRSINRVNPMFKTYMQQDAQEFLRCLIDHMHEELKYLVTYDPPSHHTTDETNQHKLLYRSHIGDTFNGTIRSRVTCNTCEQVSDTYETFQDLSLSIPSIEQIKQLHEDDNNSNTVESQVQTVSQSGYTSWYNPVSWVRYIWNSMPNVWMYMVNSEMVSLQDCLTSFFSPDRLSGDNMYSCEKCKKLRNGLKQVNITQLPEVMCIHLKRFRHDFMTSSKLNNIVTFPEILDMSSYLINKNHSAGGEISPLSDAVYSLTSIICHHGGVGGGHYTSFARHPVSGSWYEYDDSYCTQVPLEMVLSSQAYILFYQREPNREVSTTLDKYKRNLSTPVPTNINSKSTLPIYISRAWLIRFLNGASPGPIYNEFTCIHGNVRPLEWEVIDGMVHKIDERTWTILHKRFGGSSPVRSLVQCTICCEALKRLNLRRQIEWEEVKTRYRVSSHTQYALSQQWFNKWHNFISHISEVAPGLIDNTSISRRDKIGYSLRPRAADVERVGGPVWRYLYRIYGGKPILKLTLNSDETDSENEEEQPVLQVSSSSTNTQDTADTQAEPTTQTENTMPSSQL